jgi:hypothetical protein
MKAIPPAASCRVMERHLQVVFAREPEEDTLSLLKPYSFFSRPVYLKASRDRRAYLHGLLIEAGLLSPFSMESVESNGRKGLPVVTVLLVNKPRFSVAR